MSTTPPDIGQQAALSGLAGPSTRQAGTPAAPAAVSPAKEAGHDTGVASSLVNVGQQVGGALGLAILGTVAWSAVANSLRLQAGAAQHGSRHHALRTGSPRDRSTG